MSLVLDASVTLSWFFDDEGTAASIAVFDRVLQEGAVVPVLWRFEVANVLQTAVRKGRISAADRDDSLADLASIPISIDMDSIDLVWSMSLELAQQHRLTIYDAAYLEVARRRHLPLATLDVALSRAARAERVPFLGLSQ